MAKKVVATLQTGEGRSWSKVIKMVRSEKTGAYVRRPINDTSPARLLKTSACGQVFFIEKAVRLC